MADKIAQQPEHRGPFQIPEGPVERICRWACIAALITMLSVIAVDIFTRSVLNFSYEIADELAGYMLVAMTFLSFPVCQVSGAFHEVELVQARLSPRRRAISRAIFDLAALTVTLLLLWQYIGLIRQSLRFGETAPTYLATPLWIPRIVMVVGMAALAIALTRTFLAHVQAARGAAREHPHGR